MLFTILNLPDIKGTALLCRLERVPTKIWFPSSTPLLLTTAGVYAHPTPENKRKAVEVLAAVFGRESKKVADVQIEERTGVVTPMFEN
jgi:hypothetical protein